MQGERFCQTFILLGLEGLSKEIGSGVGESRRGKWSFLRLSHSVYFTAKQEISVLRVSTGSFMYDMR